MYIVYCWSNGLVWSRVWNLVLNPETAQLSYVDHTVSIKTFLIYWTQHWHSRTSIPKRMRLSIAQGWVTTHAAHHARSKLAAKLKTFPSLSMYIYHLASMAIRLLVWLHVCIYINHHLICSTNGHVYLDRSWLPLGLNDNYSYSMHMTSYTRIKSNLV